MQAGDIVLEEEPYCHVLLQKHKSFFCERCFIRQDGLKKCTGCGVTYYCGRICQKRDWTMHKKECLCLKKVSPKSPVDSVRLMLRLIISLDLGLPMNSPFSRKFEDLMTHKDEIRADITRSKQFAQMAHTLQAYATDIISLPSASMVFEIFCKMMINSFTITDEVLDHIGTGVYLSGSLLDHSCCPNAVATFLGNTLVIRAIRDIPDPSPNKVYISYIEQLSTTEERQDQLQKQYYFRCQCDKCKDINLIRKDLFCESRDIPYQMKREITAKEIVQLIHSCISRENEQMKKICCPTCDETLDFTQESQGETRCKICGDIQRSHLDRIDKVLRKCKEFVSETNTTEESTHQLGRCKLLLKDVGGLVPFSNINHLRLLDKALLAAIDSKDWDTALEFGCKTLEPYRSYCPGLSLNYALQLYKVGKLQLYRQRLHEARKNLCQAQTILSCIYKEDSKRSPMFTELTDLIRQNEEELRVRLEQQS